MLSSIILLLTCKEIMAARRPKEPTQYYQNTNKMTSGIRRKTSLKDHTTKL